MTRTAAGPVRRTAPPTGAPWRAILVGALLVLIGFALCGYPRSAAPNVPASAVKAQALSIELNIPAFRLDVWDAGTLVRSYSVAVGMRRYKTPTGDFEIARVIWNPWWYPPDAEWAAKDTITPPGPRNPMGKVKLLFNGPYYLHGTPLVSSLGHAASHGCVRMRNEDAVELAGIVQRHGGMDVNEALWDSLTSSWKKTRVLNLSRFIPVTIVYRTAEVRDSALRLYPDVYRRLSEGPYAGAMSTLLAAGIDTALVDTHLVRQLARRATRTSISAPLRQLVGPVAIGGLTP